jgi:hypothetical protein
LIRVVLIKWRDAAAAAGWHDQSQLAEQLERSPTLCESVGLLVERRNKEKVTIIQTVGANEVSGVFEIPVACVQSVETLCTLPVSLELE